MKNTLKSLTVVTQSKVSKLFLNIFLVKVKDKIIKIYKIRNWSPDPTENGPSPDSPVSATLENSLACFDQLHNVDC